MGGRHPLAARFAVRAAAGRILVVVAYAVGMAYVESAGAQHALARARDAGAERAAAASGGG